MVKKDRKKKKKAPRRRKPRPSDIFSETTSAGGRGLSSGTAATAGASLLRRLRSFRIVSGEDEHPADIAVCQPRKTDQRDPEWAADVDVVREALNLVSSGKDEAARNTLRRIPRRSPLSQWRLFLSGLSDWYAGDVEQAESAWQRLDPSRRPARIAAALRKAGSSADPAAETVSTTDQAPSAGPLDETTLDRRASLVRSLRFERPAIEELAQATSRRGRPREGEKFPFQLVDWLVSFRATYSEYEPELVAATQRNALALAFSQPEAPVFLKLAALVAGPPHDPKNRLYLTQYLDKFQGAEEEVEVCRRDYLKHDLPACKELNPPTRAAIESLLHLQTARENQAPPPSGLFSMFMGPEIYDTREAEDAFKAAIKAYPAHRTAHREYVELLRNAGAPHRDTKKDEEARDRRIRRVMERWSKSLPDDVEPRLWLVNHYLESEELKSAQPHVEMLQRQRLQDPRVRSLPWRWALFESMRLSRYKRQVGQAREQLEQAKSLWPEWLANDWIPFLRAALAWRAGEKENLQRLREQADASVGALPLLSNIMLYAAARRMRVPSGEIKSLRATVTRLTDDAESLDLTDLLKTGSFLWDLDRTEMLYTGYRTHGPRLLQEVSKRLGETTATLPDEPIGPAALWCAGSRFGSDTYHLHVPRLVDERKTTDPLAGASVLRGIDELPFVERRLASEMETYEFVKSAIDTTRDPFYRHYFQTLVDNLAQHIAPAVERARFGQRDVDDASDRFWDDEDDDDDELWDDEEELCQCDNCRRARGELDPDEDIEDLFGPTDPAEELAQRMEELAELLEIDDPETLRKAAIAYAEAEVGMAAEKQRQNTKKKRR